uniref:Uncharacterized protein n=1 Tax=Rhizophora mucronata TaxID=61149 RepID=A0A2P2NF24_RHIMU
MNEFVLLGDWTIKHRTTTITSHTPQ